MAELLKNLYNEEYIKVLSQTLQKHYAHFDTQTFTKNIFDTLWKDKELKQRMRHISTTLGIFLPKDYQQSVSILKKSFSCINSHYQLENMIFQDYVEVYGLNDLSTSLDALEHFTIQSSSEFAIRQFILKFPHETMQKMTLWAKDKNEHIRRLASEGCRPRLPWAIALPLFKKNPQKVLEILELLKDDTSKYVQKSVANNLNDISKDNPHIVKEITKKWIGKYENRDWILKHGCRTLLKDSDKQTLAFFGFHANENLTIENFCLNDNVAHEGDLCFSFSLKSKEELGKLRIEYSIDFLRKNNTHNTKVFKISEAMYIQNTKEISKTYSFAPISTRKYYKGLHYLSIIINGEILKKEKFILN